MRVEVENRPIFLSADYLRELVRRNKRRAEDPGAAEGINPPPPMPASAFILGDEVIECEAEA